MLVSAYTHMNDQSIFIYGLLFMECMGEVQDSLINLSNYTVHRSEVQLLFVPFPVKITELETG